MTKCSWKPAASASNLSCNRANAVSAIATAKPAAEAAKPGEKPLEKPAEKPVSPTAERHEAINKTDPVSADAGTVAPTAAPMAKGKDAKKKAAK